MFSTSNISQSQSRLGPSDAELIAVCLANPEDADWAYPQLIKRYERRIIAQLYGLTRDLQAAEELAHESFVTGYLQLEKLENPKAFPGWIGGIAKNMFRAWIRSGKKRGRGMAGLDHGQSHSGIGLAVEGAADPQSQPREAHRRDSMAALHAEVYRILNDMKDPYREVLLCRYFDDMSCQEIADALGRPLNTVTKQLSRGHAMLADQLSHLKGFTTTLALWLPTIERRPDDDRQAEHARQNRADSRSPGGTS